MNKTNRMQYAKILISCALMVAASIGLCFYAAGVFYEPLSAQLSINLGEASSTTTIMLVFMAASALLLPALLSKVPLHYLLMAGTVLAAGGSLGISFSLNLFWLYLFCALQGIGAACIGMVPAMAIVNHWFNEKKSIITSLVLASSALAAAVFTPLFSYSISSLGVRMSYVVQAVLILFLMLPALLWKITLTPERAGMSAYGAVQAAEKKKRSRTSLKILVILACTAILSAALIGLPQHFPTLVTSIGQPALLGASMVSLAMLGNIVFKLLGGILSERYKSVIACGILDLLVLAATIGLLISLNMPQANVLRILAFFYGASYALAELALPILVGSSYGKRQYTAVYALLNCLSTITTAIFISLIGFWYSAVHSYIWILGAAIGAEAVIILLVWMLLVDSKADAVTQNEKTSPVIGKLRSRMAANAQKRKDAKAQKEAIEAAKKAAAKKAEAAQSTESGPISIQVEPAPVRQQEEFDLPAVKQAGQSDPETEPQTSEETDQEEDDLASKYAASADEPEDTLDAHPAADLDNGNEKEK